MPSLLEFAITVMAISLPRVVFPSPLLVTAFAYGLKSGGKSGLRIAFGHTLVALPLAILLSIGAISLSLLPEFGSLLSLLGAISLFCFAGFQILEILKKPSFENFPKYRPFYAGVFLSALNPSFITWWLTIGFKLITDGYALFSVTGIATMFVSHLSLDYPG
jgi:threonine/homoserine/homoserine lactone efflux protein